MRILLLITLLCVALASSCSSDKGENAVANDSSPSSPTPDYPEMERATTAELARVCGLSEGEAIKLVDNTAASFTEATGKPIDRQGMISLFLAFALKVENDLKKSKDQKAKVDCLSVANDILRPEAGNSANAPPQG